MPLRCQVAAFAPCCFTPVPYCVSTSLACCRRQAHLQRLGGYITAGYLATRWQELGPPDTQGVFSDFRAKLVDPILRFSRRRIDVLDALAGMLPWTSAAHELADTYTGLMGEGTLQHLPDAPQFIFCATNCKRAHSGASPRPTPATTWWAA